jgi:hypothetical protein
LSLAKSLGEYSYHTLSDDFRKRTMCRLDKGLRELLLTPRSNRKFLNSN